MNFQTDNVDWTNNLEEFLKMLGEHSLCLSIRTCQNTTSMLPKHPPNTPKTSQTHIKTIKS